MKAKSLKGERTRQRILNTAADILKTKGFHGMSVDDILAKSQTGKSQFYHYFTSKEALVFELIELFDWKGIFNSPQKKQDTDNLISNKLAPGKFSSIKDFCLWLDEFSEDFDTGRYRYGCPLGNLASEMASQNESIRSLLHEIFTTWIENLTAELTQLKERSLVPEHLNPNAAATLIISSLQGALILAKTTGNGEPLKSSIRMIKQFLMASSRPETKCRRSKGSPLLSFAP